MFNMLHFIIELWVSFIFSIAYYVIEKCKIFNGRQKFKECGETLSDSNLKKKINYKLTKKQRYNTQLIKKNKTNLN